MLAGLKAKRSVEAILYAPDKNTPELKDAVLRLHALGSGAVPRLIDALQYHHNSDVIESLLLALLDRQNEAQFLNALSNKDGYILGGVARVLAKAPRINPNQLLPLFKQSTVSKAALIHILLQHKDTLDPRALIKLIDDIDKENRQAYFKLIEHVANDAIVPELKVLVEHDDPAVRQFAVRLLASFPSEDSRDILLRLLQDPHKVVRYAALGGLGTLSVPVSAEPITALLKDPDMTVQAKAIETLVKIDDPDTVGYLITILEDESEYIRRAAVEVLNEVGNANAVKDLIRALKDRDWWVKVRAADALGNIGGPRVVEAVFELIKDEDEFLRRTAVEILNTTKDKRAFDYLLEALKDADWWVRERAADALANLGDARAADALIAMMRQYPEASHIAIKALATLGDQRAIQPILDRLHHSDVIVQREALQALGTLVDKETAATVQNGIAHLLNTNDVETRDLAEQTLQTLISRFGHLVSQDSAATTFIRAGANGASVRSGDEETFDLNAPSPTPPPSEFNINNLSAGTIIENRYRVIRKVGEGAFGIVMLVEDMAVNEEIILKFLNPRVASDESVVKRFVHELRFARKITNENVIRIYDFISLQNAYAISMEYFESHSLAFELKQGAFKDRARAIRILCDIITGIRVAHRANVVHRDLKPANILINDDDLVKVVDFGLAAAASSTDSRVTKSGILVGTPTYMAPEQARGQAIDLRTDIYSLGIIMYEMFTGRPPYTGSDSMAILFKHVEGKPTPPRELNPDITEALQAVILKALMVDRAQRYQSIDALHTALTALDAVAVN